MLIKNHKLKEDGCANFSKFYDQKKKMLFCCVTLRNAPTKMQDKAKE